MEDSKAKELEKLIPTCSYEATAKAPQVFVDRPALTVDMRHKQCSFEEKEKSSTGTKINNKAKKCCNFSKERLWKILVSKLPILGWLIGYDVKNWLLGDIIAGVTIAIFHIPQGMGFALLANVPAICGIYMALYPVIIYALLTTSMHNSMGSFAVITLMTGKVVRELATFPVMASQEILSNMTETVLEQTTESNLIMDVEAYTYTPIQIATIVCLMVGVWQTLFGLMQLGALSVFLSDMLVSGFTTAAAVHVLTSQLPSLLGIKVASFTGPLKLIYVYCDIFKSLSEVNIATLVISLVTIGCLLFNNELIKPFVAKYTKLPIPIELIAVIAGTAASYLARFNENFEVQIIGDIPTGLPPASIPPIELIGKVAVDSLVIAIVAYTISYSVAKIIGIKHDYEVDATQELYAQGLGNVFSSFFSCPPMATALARTLIQDAVGGKTQLASLINCVIILFILLFIGPLFETLPKACLASVIVVALKGMFMQVKDMAAMWKVSRIEAITWIVTFLSTVIVDIDFGLLIGVVFSLFVLIAKNQSPATATLGNVPNTDLYLDMVTYPQALSIPGLIIFKVTGSLHFANRDNLKKCLIKGTGLNAKDIIKKKKTELLDEEQTKKLYLILDISGVSYMDSAGGRFLDRLRSDYEKADITLCLAGVSESAMKLLEKCGSLDHFNDNHLFHSVHDAVTILSHDYTQF